MVFSPLDGMSDSSGNCKPIPQLIDFVGGLTRKYFQETAAEEVTLFQGMTFERSDLQYGWNPLLDVVRDVEWDPIIRETEYVARRPFESSAIDLSIARKFSTLHEGVGVVIAATIPVFDVFPTWFAGAGVGSEREVVVSKFTFAVPNEI